MCKKGCDSPRNYCVPDCSGTHSLECVAEWSFTPLSHRLPEENAEPNWNARGRREGTETLLLPAASSETGAVCGSEYGKPTQFKQHAARLGGETGLTLARGQGGLQYKPVSKWEKQEQSRLWCTHVLPMLRQGPHSQMIRNSRPASPTVTEAGLGYTKVSKKKNKKKQQQQKKKTKKKTPTK